MPLYEYECSSCGCGFEQFHRIDDRNNVVCPGCGGFVWIKPSLMNFRTDIPVTFFTHDGKVLDKKPHGLNAPIGRPNEANITMV